MQWDCIVPSNPFDTSSTKKFFNSGRRNIKHIFISFALTSFAYLNLSLTFNCITFLFYVFAKIKVLSTSWKLHSYPSKHEFGYFLRDGETSSGELSTETLHTKKALSFPAISSYLGHPQITCLHF
jgi:hypothetical protein